MIDAPIKSCGFCGESLSVVDKLICARCRKLIERLRADPLKSLTFTRLCGSVPIEQLRTVSGVDRNAKCPCGSGKKFKRCCMIKEPVCPVA